MTENGTTYFLVKNLDIVYVHQHFLKSVVFKLSMTFFTVLFIEIEIIFLFSFELF